MRVRRRTNLVWGLVLLALAGVLAGRALGLIPEGVFDLVKRAWPALLVLGGLATFLRSRIPLGGAVALLLTAALVAGVTSVAFSTRASQPRDDYRETVAQPVSTTLSLLRVRVQTLATEVELLRSLESSPAISGQFVGSAESRVIVDYAEGDDATATFTLREEQVNAFPILETMGRGTLRLELPPGIPLDVELLGRDGPVTLNMSGLALEHLNVDLQRGDALVTLPTYNPLFSQDTDTLGTLAVRDGQITLYVPADVAARFELNRGGSGIAPQYDDALYNYLVGDVLEARTIVTADVVLRYVVTAPRGRIRVEVAPAN